MMVYREGNLEMLQKSLNFNVEIGKLFFAYVEIEDRNILLAI